MRGLPTLSRHGEGVAFLNGRDAEPETLVAAIDAALATLDPDAVLTVYSSHPGTWAAVDARCDQRALRLMLALEHSSGVTLTLGRGTEEASGP